MSDHSYYLLTVQLWLVAALISAAVGSVLICDFCVGFLVVQTYGLFRAHP